MTQNPKNQRCIGHCCRRFSIGKGESYEQIQGEYQTWLENPDRDEDDEIAVIAPMLIPQGHNARGKPVFRCRNLGSNGDCQIYEKRPQMCREVGDTIPCLHPRCRNRPLSLPHRLALYLTEKTL